ncbi:MAG: C4-dicarboxylate ABC transporter permease [Gammaproteobacteria bacterium]|nr:C4-dicarboxylate ABC transporter permease [Gammaproteobacteria bacterium]
MADLMIVATIALILLLVSGLPIFLVFLTVNAAIVLFQIGPSGYGMFVNSMLNTATTQALATIPLFILMGEIIFRAGAVQRLFKSIQLVVGFIPGRQNVVTMMLAAVLSALSGASMAVAAMLGRTVLPTLLNQGYPRKICAGTILAGASLAPIVPPSVLVIILGTLAEESIAKLLVAGILPGFFLAVIFTGFIIFRSRGFDQDTDIDQGDASPFKDTMPLLFLIALVLGAILTGIATPTEAASVGVLGSLCVARLYNSLNLELLIESIFESAKLGCMIILIMICAKFFSQLLAMSGIAGGLQSLLAMFSDSPYLLLFVVMIVPFVLCMLIDQIALLLIIVPLYKSLMDLMPVEPLVFWFLLLVNITVGGITPPFGYTLFALKGATNLVSMQDIYRSVLPFVMIYFFFCILIVLNPWIVTLIPSLL